MDSGWSRFRALYDYKAQDDNEISIAVNDILIVAKPIADPQGWLLGQKEQTNKIGDVPGTYLEYIDDIEELVVPEPDPEVPPPRPPKRQGKRFAVLSQKSKWQKVRHSSLVH